MDRIQHAQQNDNPAVNRLARLVEAGWTLMADTCHRCATPLVKNTKQELYCAKCEVFFLPEGTPSRPAPPAAGGGGAAAAAGGGGGGGGSAPLSSEEFQRKRHALYESAGGAEEAEEEPAEAMVDAEAAFEARQAESNRHSERMGELLLKGWAMLQETCPRPTCAVPLLREPGTGRILCVSCGTLSGGAEPVPEPEHEPEEKPEPEVAKRHRTGPPDARAVAVSTVGTALIETMRKTGALLADTEDVAQCRVLVSLIGECARALQDTDRAAHPC